MQQKSYTQEVQKALQIAQKIGKEHIHAHYSGAHLLKAMLNRDLSLLKSLEAKGIDVFYLEEWAEVRLEELPKSTHTYSCEPDSFKRLKNIMRKNSIIIIACIFSIFLFCTKIEFKMQNYKK